MSIQKKLGRGALTSLSTIGKLVGARRKFNGKSFSLALATDTRSKAAEKAAQLRASGKLARIAYRKDYRAWFVWQR